MNKLFFISLTLATFNAARSQELVFEKEYPVSNVKNLFLTKNDKNDLLIQSYGGLKTSINIVDSTNKSKYNSNQEFDYTLYEYLATFFNEDNFYNLYINGNDLAMGIISPKGTTPYRFVKIGSLVNDGQETFFAYRELDKKSVFLTLNKKESKIGVVTVTAKGISERKMYDAPIKLSKKFDNTKFGTTNNVETPQFISVNDDKVQDITLTSNTSKTYEHDNKLFFGFRGVSEYGKFYCTKFLMFDNASKSFKYTEVPDSLIGRSFEDYDRTNYTFSNGKIYFIQLAQENCDLVIYDLDFKEINRINTRWSTAAGFPFTTLYQDGEDDAIGNKVYLTETTYSTRGDLIAELFSSKHRISNMDFKSSIAVNLKEGKEVFTFGIARKTYVKLVSPSLMGIPFTDLANIPIGSVNHPTNYNFRRILLPYFSKDHGVNFQSRYLVATLDAKNHLSETGIKSNPAYLFRSSLSAVLPKVDIKDITVNQFGNDYYFSIVDKLKKKIQIYKLPPASR